MTPAERCLVLIVCRRGENTVSDKHWEEWTGLKPTIKDNAIRGLKEKGLVVRGRGDRAKFYFERDKWDAWVRTRPRHERARTVGRSKSVTAKTGMQIHQECQSRGCARLCEPQVIPFPATQNERPVVQTLPDPPPKEDQSPPPKGSPPHPPKAVEVRKQEAGLQQLIGIFLSLGVAMSEADLRKCAKFWAQLSSTEKSTALAYAIARHQSEWSECATRYIPRPWNFLAEKHWERGTPVEGRAKTKTKGDKAHEAAAKMFREGVWNTKI